MRAPSICPRPRVHCRASSQALDMTSGDSEAIEGQGWSEGQFLRFEPRGGEAELRVIGGPATRRSRPFEEPTTLWRSSGSCLLSTAKSFDLGSRAAHAEHAVPLQSENRPCQHDSGDPVGIVAVGTRVSFRGAGRSAFVRNPRYRLAWEISVCGG